VSVFRLDSEGVGRDARHLILSRPRAHGLARAVYVELYRRIGAVLADLWPHRRARWRPALLGDGAGPSRMSRLRKLRTVANGYFGTIPGLTWNPPRSSSRLSTRSSLRVAAFAYRLWKRMRARRGFIVAMVIAALVVVGAIIVAFGGNWGTDSYSERVDALVARMCEITRDIAGDAADGVDTLSETRDRYKHLLEGYGVNAPADIRTPLRNAVSALTAEGADALGRSVGRLESACRSRGF